MSTKSAQRTAQLEQIKDAMKGDKRLFLASRSGSKVSVSSDLVLASGAAPTALPSTICR